jgi:hypothetical protein
VKFETHGVLQDFFIRTRLRGFTVQFPRLGSGTVGIVVLDELLGALFVLGSNCHDRVGNMILIEPRKTQILDEFRGDPPAGDDAVPKSVPVLLP